MTGTICSVANCKSNFEKAKKEGNQIRFFRFPNYEKLRKLWIQFCKRKDKFDSKNKRVCSKHFEMEQYEDLVHARLTNTEPRKLKETGRYIFS